MVKEVMDQLEQSTLSKAVKNVKQKLLTKQKKTEAKIPVETSLQETTPFNLNRGVVYLGHIPHGFFEEQMKEYFKQFGKVTRVRLARSKKTGRSRGYGYIEFAHCDVAKIAAESMNNYLMCGRLLKATYIPPEKQHTGFFIGRQWTKQSYPRLINRVSQNTQKNKNVDNKVEASLVQRGLSRISNMQKRLEAVGIVYKITPVELPTTIVKKRKATPQLPPEEIKKRKIASVESASSEARKETEIAEPAVNKIIKKRVKSVEETNEKKIPDILAVKKSNKKIKSTAPLTSTTKQSIEKSSQKKISVIVPSIKKTKQKSGAQVSLKKNGKKNNKSLAA